MADKKGLALVIGVGKPKGADRSAPMGDDDAEGETKEGAGAESSEFDSALNDAFDAVKAGDRDGFLASMGAAISTKCAEMYGSSDEGAEKAAE